MATLTPFTKPNATLAKQSPPPPGNGTTWTQPPVPPRVTGGVGYTTQVVPQPPPILPAPVTQPRAVSGALPGVAAAPGLGGPGYSQQTPFQTSTQGNVNNTYTPTLDEGTILEGYLNQFIGADNALMRDARMRGIEAAAGAGLQNSSLAAGASQRAALDVAVPLATQAFGLFGDRENRQWGTDERLGQQSWQTGEREATQGWQTNERLGTQEWTRREEQRQRDWTADQNRLDRDQQITMSQVQNWLNNESFMREFNANLSLLPITNTTQLLNTIMQQAVDNPQVYTPDVVSGLSEFFTTNFLDVLSRYFPSMYAQTGGS